MDNNAVYAAQQAQLGKIYGGLDPSCRRPEDLGGQTTINSRYAYKIYSALFIFTSVCAPIDEIR